MEIKVCGLKIPTNVQAILQLEIDYIGLIFYEKSPRYVELPPEEFDGFEKLNNRHIKRVGVFVDAPVAEVARKVKEYKLDYVQLHGKENVFYCSQLQGAGIKIIKAFSIDEKFIFTLTDAYQYYCDYFLFDTKGAKPGGNGVTFDWNILERYRGTTPFFLSGGLTPEMAVQIKALRLPRLHAVDINSRFEIEPGFKDVVRVSEFVNELRNRKLSDWGTKLQP